MKNVSNLYFPKIFKIFKEEIVNPVTAKGINSFSLDNPSANFISKFLSSITHPKEHKFNLMRKYIEFLGIFF